MKKSVRTTCRTLSCVLTLCILLGGFSVGQFMVAADEVTGYQNEAVVCFKNAGSGKYLNVHYGQDSNNVNVYQWTKDESTEQKFRLRYNLEDDCYLIGAMCSNNGNGRVLDIVKSGGEVAAGCNVQIYNAVDPVAQQWQIRYEEDGKFAIYPIDNYFLLLTANGSSNGSSSGTSSTSVGNVYLSQMSTQGSPNDYQMWMIEEVNPQATIPSGNYRIKNVNGKFITADADNASNVHQLRDPGSISGLDEWEQSTLLGQQLWNVQYLCSGYYLIRLAKDTTQKLGATGNFSTIQATAHITTQSNTSDCLVQWKIVPNVQGGYRIVNKSEYNTQALTVRYGDDTDGTRIVMCPYVNGTSQQWTFGTTGLCQDNSLGEHVLGFVTSSASTYAANASTTASAYYHCYACNRNFGTPQMQDYAMHTLPDEVLTAIFALERMAMLEQIAGGKEHFVQACYRAADVLRTEYGAEDAYAFQDQNGNYLSPVTYTYDADSINASVEFEVTVYGEQYAAERVVLWKVGQTLPAPFSNLSEILLTYADPSIDYSQINLTGMLIQTVIDTGVEVLSKKLPNDTMMKDSLETMCHASTLKSLCSEGITSNIPFIEVDVRVYDEDCIDTFKGVYDISAGRQMRIFKEEQYMVDRTVPLESAPENLIDGIFEADNGAQTYIYDDLFT